MAQIRAIEARGLLDDIAFGAMANSIDLIDAIRAAKAAILSPAFKQGRVFISTSGNGQSASFQIPSNLTADYTPTRVAAQLMEFVEIYNDAVTNGIITDSSATEADLAAMLADDRLQSITARQQDITLLRVPWGGVTR